MSLEVLSLDIPDVKLVKTKKHGDHRGFFSEVYNKQTFIKAGIDLEFVQDNHAMSQQKGVLRGLHYQIDPFAQDKFVRVVKGRIFDVAVDIRRSSPTFGKWVGAEISADNWQQILVPRGFAHGYVTLEEDTEVLYKVTGLYAPDHDRGIIWNDPAIGIEWPVAADQVVLSDKDTKHKPLAETADLFD